MCSAYSNQKWKCEFYICKWPLVALRQGVATVHWGYQTCSPEGALCLSPTLTDRCTSVCHVCAAVSHLMVEFSRYRRENSSSFGYLLLLPNYNFCFFMHSSRFATDVCLVVVKQLWGQLWIELEFSMFTLHLSQFWWCHVSTKSESYRL